jgi:uncharacterized membrane protein YedE/YeeE
LPSVFVAVLGRLGYIPLKPRAASTLGLLSRYDGNLLGGALLGIGMALSGACPGTVLAQTAVGVRSGFFALDGAILGGITYVGFIRPWMHARTVKINKEDQGQLTLHEKLGTDRNATAAAFVAIAGAIVAATMLYTPRSPYAKVLPIVGGFIIGLAQLFSALTRATLIGSSTSYEEVGESFWLLIRQTDKSKVPRSHQNYVFAAGVIGGAYGLSQAVPSLVVPIDLDISPALATAGGFLMVMGSRIAGGCTSGHGISGISLLSISSFISISTAMVVGAIVAPLVH